MAGSLGIAVSGLRALQQAIATTGNNIVNVNTEGFNRQIVDFASQPSTRTGAGFVGNGVKTTGIRRIYSEFLVQQVRDFSSSASNLGTVADLSSRLDNLLADPTAGVTANIQKFFGALSDLANNPASMPERQVVISEAQALVNQVQFLNTSLDDLNGEVNSRMRIVIDEVNVLADNIARINERIASAGSTSSGQIPNDLFDQRDRLLTSLSAKVSITTIDQNDGNINVLIGSGQPLVVGTQVTQLSVLTNELDASRLEIGFISSTASTTKITSLVRGGELQGLISFRDRILDPARNELGLMMVGLVTTFNNQHSLGLDSNGNPGQNFFKSSTPQVMAKSGNSGTALVNVAINDVNKLQASDYLLRFDGTDWQVIRQSDNESTIGSPPFSLDGLDINISGVAVAGDSYLIRPTFNAAAEFAVQITRPSQIATAGALRSENSGSNSGNAKLNGIEVVTMAGLPLPGPISLTFNPDAMGPGVPGFDVVGGPVSAVAYDPAVDSLGKQFTFAALGGLSFTIDGTPSDGDQFVIENNLGGVGDNRNALKLSGLQTSKVLESGQSTYQDVYGNLVAAIAVKTSQVKVNLNTESTLLQQAQSARESVSGVNLDEEAANLIRFQQAYQAAAQVISASQTLFQILIDATRG